MTTSVRPTTLFPRGQRRKKRKSQQKNTEAHPWILQEEMYRDENIWEWKAQAQFNFLTVNCGISPVQEQSGCLHMCIQLSLFKRRTMNRFVGVFSLSLHSSSSSTQSEETVSPQQLYVDFYPSHTTTFPLHQTDMATTVFVLFCDNSTQVKTKISQQIQVKKEVCVVRAHFHLSNLPGYNSTFWHKTSWFHCAGWSTEDLHLPV